MYGPPCPLHFPFSSSSRTDSYPPQLFAGRPSLKKLKLWAEDAIFSDPITIARGRAQFEPQWYGLQTAFSAIERLSHTVTSSGNPISLDLQNKYTVKGIGKVQVVSSKVDIYVDSKSGLIEKVEDKWNGKLPESSIANVSVLRPVEFLWRTALRVEYELESWSWWAWSFVWYTRWWHVGGLVLFLGSPRDERGYWNDRPVLIVDIRRFSDDSTR